jgi:hypothetical protein
MTISPEPKAGFLFTFFTTGFMIQDIAMALVLGFVGALGGYLFKLLKDSLISKYRK